MSNEKTIVLSSEKRLPDNDPDKKLLYQCVRTVFYDFMNKKGEMIDFVSSIQEKYDNFGEDPVSENILFTELISLLYKTKRGAL